MGSTTSTGPAATSGPATAEPAGAVATGGESPAAVPAQLVKPAPVKPAPVKTAPESEQGAEQAPAADDRTPAFTFQVQQEFHEVPLGLREAADSEDPAEALAARDEQMNGFVRDYWGGHEELEPARRLTKALYSATGEDLIADGTVYQALGFFPIDESPVAPAEGAPSSLAGITATGSPAPAATTGDAGEEGDAGENSTTGPRVSRATLTVSVREIGNPAPHITAAGIAETLDKSGDGGEVLFVTLPAGPAVVHVAGTRAVWEREEGEQERFFVRIEVWLPFPDADRLLLLCLSTPDAQDLFHYQEVLADIAGTVCFGEEQTVPATHAASADCSPFGTY